MASNWFRTFAVAATLLGVQTLTATAQQSFEAAVADVNDKMVKLYGSGGFKGIVSYGTGLVISPEGHILTVSSQLLDTQDLRVHLSNGRKLRAEVVVVEPELDLAILKLKTGEALALDLPYFNIAEAAKRKAGPGDWVLAFCNCFQIAVRDEPMSVQHSVISAKAKLSARRGIFEIPFHGEVYFLDGIVNNPGAAGGALTTKKGELLGIIGKEFRNTTTDTWTNYAIPVNCEVEVKEDDKSDTIKLVDFVTQGVAGKWKPRKRPERREGSGAYHGIVFVPNVVDNTPAYVERVEPASPAAKAGLKPDDLLVYIDGEPIVSIRAFKEYMAKARPGIEVKLEVRRGERLTSVELNLESFPKR